MGRYDELTRLLQERSGHVAEFAFAEIDEAIGGLPASARRHREWWGNSASPQGRAWRAAGYRVAQVDVAEEHVRFDRFSHDRPAANARRTDLELPEAGLPAAGRSHVAVEFAWRRHGAVEQENDGSRLRFPRIGSRPGIYRLTLFDEESVCGVYVGESNNLARRIRNYVRPGPTQATNLRINALIIEHLRRGHVAFDVAGEVRFTVDGLAVAVDLTRKADRVLVEHAALVETLGAGHPVANL